MSAVNSGEIKAHDCHCVSSREEDRAMALIPGVTGTQASDGWSEVVRKRTEDPVSIHQSTQMNLFLLR